MTLSTPDLMMRMKGLNAHRIYQNRMKPGNFVLIGTAVMIDEESGNPIKPMGPYSNKPWEAPYSEFVDYHSGKILRGKEYWKSLDQVFLDYVNHPESKFEGDVGVLSRRHIRGTSFIHIGKEANKIDEVSVLGLQEGDVEVYDNRAEERRRIKKDPFSVSYREADLAGVSRSSLKRWRKKMMDIIT